MSTSGSTEELLKQIQALPEDAQETIIDRIAGSVGLRQMMKMVGLQSVKSGTDYEADALQREADAIECEVYGSDPKQREQKGQDDMRDILATGNVYIGNKNEQEESQSPPAPQKPPMSKPLAYGLGGAALAAALTLPILAWNMTRKESPPAEQVNLGARFVPVPDNLISE